MKRQDEKTPEPLLEKLGVIIREHELAPLTRQDLVKKVKVALDEEAAENGETEDEQDFESMLPNPLRVLLPENEKAKEEIGGSFAEGEIEPPSPLMRSASNHNSGVLPSIWMEDLAPHLDVLESIEKGTSTSPSTMELSLREVQHLVLVIHGIGKHQDFQNECMSFDGTFGELSGGFYDFKSKFYEILGGVLKDLPLFVHFEGIEWHEAVREACNVEDVLKESAPDGVASLREYVTDTMIDGWLYLFPRFGQTIIDNVAYQLNEKYAYFMETHPGFTGPVSIFAHSLGSLITFDLLTRARTDITTPKLNFNVNVVFMAGSPLAYLQLCRGNLFDKMGVYRAQYFLPKSVRVVNMFHSNDPVAWRIGPLLAGDDKELQHVRNAVQLPFASDLEGEALDSIVIKFAELFNFSGDDAKADQDNCLRRPVDLCLPTSRYERVVELASAMSAHSAYWANSAVTMGVIMTLCEPLMPVLMAYRSKKVPVKIVPRRMKLDLSRDALLNENVMVEGHVRGFWTRRFLIMQEDGLYVFDKPLWEAVGKFQGEIDLAQSRIKFKSDDGTEVTLSGKETAELHPKALDFKIVAWDAVTYTITANSRAEAKWWIDGIQKVLRMVHRKNHPKMESDTETEGELETSTDEDDELADNNPGLFNLTRHGILHVSISSQWSGKSRRWFCLKRNSVMLRFYDSQPSNDPRRQIEIQTVNRIQTSKSQRLLRLVYQSGGSIAIRFSSEESWENWTETLQQFCGNASIEELILREDVFGNPSHHIRSDSAEQTVLSVAVTGFLIETEPNGNQEFANFVVSVMFENKEGTHVTRRFREFREFYNKLYKEVKSNGGDVKQLPALPQSSSFMSSASLDEGFLNRRVQQLNGFMKALAMISLVQKCHAWMDFLLRNEQARSRSRSNSQSLPDSYATPKEHSPD